MNRCCEQTAVNDRLHTTLEMEPTTKEADKLEMEPTTKEADTLEMEPTTKEADTLEMEPTTKEADTLVMEPTTKEIVDFATTLPKWATSPYPFAQNVQALDPFGYDHALSQRHCSTVDLK